MHKGQCQTINAKGDLVNYCEHDIYLQIKDTLAPFFSTAFLPYWKQMVVSYFNNFFNLTGKVEDPNNAGQQLTINLVAEENEDASIKIKWPMGPTVVEIEIWSMWPSLEESLLYKFARYLIDEGHVDENGVIDDKLDLMSEFYNFIFNRKVMSYFDNEMIKVLSGYGFDIERTNPVGIDPPPPPNPWQTYFEEHNEFTNK